MSKCPIYSPYLPGPESWPTAKTAWPGSLTCQAGGDLPARFYGPTPLLILKRWSANLTVQVLVAIALGVAVGALFPTAGPALKPIVDTFINLLKMLIAPIIFLAVVLGIAGVGNLRQGDRVGGKALLYFEMVTISALAIGVGMANLTQPGAGGR